MTYIYNIPHVYTTYFFYLSAMFLLEESFPLYVSILFFYFQVNCFRYIYLSYLLIYIRIYIIALMLIQSSINQKIKLSFIHIRTPVLSYLSLTIFFGKLWKTFSQVNSTHIYSYPVALHSSSI